MRKIETYLLAMFLGTAVGCVVDADNDDDDAGQNSADGGDAGPTDAEIESTCQSYCDQAKVCDDDVTVTTCVADCKEKMGDCMADEQDQALGDLTMCAGESCDDFTGCTIGAGLQCSFGI